MKRIWSKARNPLVVLLSALILCLPTLTFSSIPSSAEEDGHRTVLLELMTATWCATCPYADEASDKLSMDYGPERLVVLQYHVSLDGLDTPETNERRDDYNAVQTGLPAAWFDGTEGVHSVGEPSSEFFYNLYSDAIEERLEKTSPITISASIVGSSGEITVTALFGKAMDTSIPTDVQTRYVLYENGVAYPPGSGKIYNYVVRDVEIKDFDYSALPYSEQVVFGVESGWNPQNMGIAVFIQTYGAGEVLQSANAYLASKPVVTITSEIEGSEVSGPTKIQGTASGSVEYVMVRIDNARYKKAEGTNNWEITIDPSQMADGDHTIQVRAYSRSLVYSEVIEAGFSSRNGSLLLYLLITIVVIVIIVALGFLLIRRRMQKE